MTRSSPSSQPPSQPSSQPSSRSSSSASRPPPDPRPDPRSGHPAPRAPGRELLAGYLVLIGTLLLLWGIVASNGADEVGGGLRALGAAEIGVYRVADAPKRAGVGIDAAAATRLGGPTLHQRGLCAVGRVARDCNVPVVELPLGPALGLGALLFGLGAALAEAHRSAAVRRGLLLLALAPAATLTLSGHANGVAVGAGVGEGLRQGRLGLYRATVAADAERRWALPRRLAPALTAAPVTLYQPDACVQGWRAATGDGSGCNEPLVELRLAWLWLAATAVALAGAALLLTAPPAAAPRAVVAADGPAGRSP